MSLDYYLCFNVYMFIAGQANANANLGSHSYIIFYKLIIRCVSYSVE